MAYQAACRNFITSPFRILRPEEVLRLRINSRTIVSAAGPAHTLGGCASAKAELSQVTRMILNTQPPPEYRIRGPGLTRVSCCLLGSQFNQAKVRLRNRKRMIGRPISIADRGDSISTASPVLVGITTASKPRTTAAFPDLGRPSQPMNGKVSHLARSSPRVCSSIALLSPQPPWSRPDR